MSLCTQSCFYWIKFDVSILKQNYIGFCYHVRYFFFREGTLGTTKLSFFPNPRNSLRRAKKLSKSWRGSTPLPSLQMSAPQGKFFGGIIIGFTYDFLLPFSKCPTGDIFFGYYHWIHIELIGFLRSDAPFANCDLRAPSDAPFRKPHPLGAFRCPPSQTAPFGRLPMSPQDHLLDVRAIRKKKTIVISSTEIRLKLTLVIYKNMSLVSTGKRSLKSIEKVIVLKIYSGMLALHIKTKKNLLPFCYVLVTFCGYGRPRYLDKTLFFSVP